MCVTHRFDLHFVILDVRLGEGGEGSEGGEGGSAGGEGGADGGEGWSPGQLQPEQSKL